jgi:hypothetical protein
MRKHCVAMIATAMFTVIMGQQIVNADQGWHEEECCWMSEYSCCGCAPVGGTSLYIQLSSTPKYICWLSPFPEQGSCLHENLICYNVVEVFTYTTSNGYGCGSTCSNRSILYTVQKIMELCTQDTCW